MGQAFFSKPDSISKTICEKFHDFQSYFPIPSKTHIIKEMVKVSTASASKAQ